ncbi:MAG: flagellar biosynthesis protein FliL [Gammaproteobacteria bacterium]|nr:flagellar biosynthesis protein FliL [Gammaproteobacteria bacterium]MCP4277908.1 flagellar biosynthesis protein FliL [Gammaproteobacteria bacterium]
MAEEEVDEDLDLGEEQQGGSKKKLIIIAGAAVLVLLLGGGAAWFFMSGDEEAAPESAETEQADGDEKDTDADKDGGKEQGPALYRSLDPVFVVNLPPDSGAKMMQIGVNLMMRSPKLLEFVKLNDPMIRHQLLNLFSVQDAKALRKRSGKEKLQGEALEAIQKIVKEQGGPGKVEAVYFTSFVMQ